MQAWQFQFLLNMKSEFPDQMLQSYTDSKYNGTAIKNWYTNNSHVSACHSIKGKGHRSHTFIMNQDHLRMVKGTLKILENETFVTLS